MAKKIFIDAGHSRKLGDVGAVSDGFIEFDINSTVAKNMQTVLLRDYDCEVIVDYDSAIGANCRTAVDRGCSAFISTHENAGGGDGAEVYYYSTDAKAKALAQSILTEITNIGQNSRGIKGGDKFGMCSTLKNIIPTVLVEGFFVDNKKDRAQFDTPEELMILATAIAKGVAKYLQLPLRTVVVTPPVNQVELYQVRIIDKTGLNYRPSAGGNPVLGTYPYGKVISIYEEKGKWGRTGDGHWICIMPVYVEKVVPEPIIVTPPVVVEPPVVTPPIVVEPPVVIPPIVTPPVVMPVIPKFPSIFKDVAGLLKRLLKVRDKI